MALLTMSHQWDSKDQLKGPAFVKSVKMKRYNNLQVEKQKQLQIVFKTKSSSQLFVATAVMTVKHQVFIVIHSSIYLYIRVVQWGNTHVCEL